MTRNRLTLISGIIVLVMPFLGFPPGWKTFFYVLCGLVLIWLSVVAYMRRRARELHQNETHY